METISRVPAAGVSFVSGSSRVARTTDLRATRTWAQPSSPCNVGAIQQTTRPQTHVVFVPACIDTLKKCRPLYILRSALRPTNLQRSSQLRLQYRKHSRRNHYVTFTMGALNLIPLVILFLVVGGIGWVGYQVRHAPQHAFDSSNPAVPRVFAPLMRIPLTPSRRSTSTRTSSPSAASVRWRRRTSCSPRTARRLVSGRSAQSSMRIRRRERSSRRGTLRRTTPRLGTLLGRGGHEHISWEHERPARVRARSARRFDRNPTSGRATQHMDMSSFLFCILR